MNLARCLCLCAASIAAPAMADMAVYSTLTPAPAANDVVARFSGITRDDVTITSIAQPLTLARVWVYGGTGAQANGTLTVSIRAAIPNGNSPPTNGTTFGNGSAALSVAPEAFSIVDVPLPNLAPTTTYLWVTFTYAGTGTGVGVGYNHGAATVGTNGRFAVANGFVESLPPGFGLGFDFELQALPSPGAAGLLVPSLLLAARRRR